jgi:murein DD-endopeptidase MepM/ murein hydrolase activator NlpD
MDKTVYFATLDQYKYNPAIVISGEVNDKVVAAADGQVISVDTSAEIGETVTIELGDEYQTIYGQLKEVEVSAGDFVSRGDVIGYISEPTKYYAVEGSNLYFAMTKSGNPINPMDYFE